ncbi:PREDICTED: transcription termination factor MTERF6, chloroplastic/mitochondrial-like [Tarenaya hassleriana]|uniref:transcription termination factor MTERF6, chloroplastic/mitochondrial-like n=1 Tax=Tarenaya hassleriana TaxID=28532 RepID=UPI00053C9A76|nr:PREDICTED: transcription termination factor MTERF6, chloroplastic/mitochondrial-like [Tarenaya hassleriana]
MSGENGGSSSGIMWFFRDKGFDDQSIQKMVKKCKQLQNSPTDLASENWSYLKSIGIHERKLPHIVSRCPKILTFRLHERVQCLSTLGSNPRDVASAITKFPNVLSHGVEERLCPLLAFFQALGVPEKQLGKMLLLNPRLISYSIDTKLSDIVSFLSSLGLSRDGGMVGKVLMKNPFFMGYSVEKRLRPTIDFLRSVVGLREEGIQTVVMNFPEVVCRDSDKILRPNFEYLKRCGFGDADIVTMVTGYPPILIKSIKNSLEPRIRFLVEKMGRGMEEVVDYPEYFRHGLKKRVESRYKLLKQKNITCSLSEMLDCNTNKFRQRFGFSEGVA